MTSNTQKWVAFLEGLEAEVKAAHAALDIGDSFDPALLEPWSPPADLEALPVELLERAQEINTRLTILNFAPLQAKTAFSAKSLA